MNHVATNFLFQQPPSPEFLPPSQFDRRNALGLRFLEVGFAIPNDTILPDYSPAFEIAVSMADLDAEFQHDPSVSFRVITIGLESFSIRHFGTFVPEEREPVCVAIPQIDNLIGTRYTTFFPSDAGQGLAGAISVNLVGKLPGSLLFKVGLCNPLPNDDRIYNFNATRTSDPVWATQRIRSITLRFYVKAQYEPNYIPFVNLPHIGMSSGTRGKIGGQGMTPPAQGTSGPTSSNETHHSGVVGGRAQTQQQQQAGGAGQVFPDSYGGHPQDDGGAPDVRFAEPDEMHKVQALQEINLAKARSSHPVPVPDVPNEDAEEEALVPFSYTRTQSQPGRPLLRKPRTPSDPLPRARQRVFESLEDFEKRRAEAAAERASILSQRGGGVAGGAGQVEVITMRRSRARNPFRPSSAGGAGQVQQ